MIQRAIDQGINKVRLTTAVNIDIKVIRTKINLLNGICPEVIELLKNREISPNIFPLLRKMKPLRQIESAELLTLNNLTVPYAKALLMTTDSSMLKEPPKNLKNKGAFAPILIDFASYFQSIDELLKQSNQYVIYLNALVLENFDHSTLNQH